MTRSTFLSLIDFLCLFLSPFRHTAKLLISNTINLGLKRFLFAYQSLTTGGWRLDDKTKHLCTLGSVYLQWKHFKNQSRFFFFYNLRKRDNSERLERITKDTLPSVLCWLKPGWIQNSWTKEHGRWSGLMNILTGKIKIWSSVLLQMLFPCSNHLSPLLMFPFLLPLLSKMPLWAAQTCMNIPEQLNARQEHLSCCWFSQVDLC